VRVAKVGDVRRGVVACPALPSSVTVVRQADGRYYASFVVEVADTPLPRSANDVGIDLGLTSLGVLSAGEVVQNPRYLRRRARALARAQKSLASKTKGSIRGAKAVRRVAVQHRRVRDTRLDAHHKLAHRIACDNQAIYVQDLAVSALGPDPVGEVGGRCWLVDTGGVVGRRRRCVATAPWSRSVPGSRRAGCARSVGSTQG
jgi:putative transposase